MHCGSVLLDYSSSKSVGLVTSNRNSGSLISLKKENCHFSSVCSFRGAAAAEFSFGPPRLEWHTLHLYSPPPTAPSRRRINSLGMLSMQSLLYIQGARGQILRHEFHSLSRTTFPSHEEKSFGQMQIFTLDICAVVIWAV